MLMSFPLRTTETLLLFLASLADRKFIATMNASCFRLVTAAFLPHGRRRRDEVGLAAFRDR